MSDNPNRLPNTANELLNNLAWGISADNISRDFPAPDASDAAFLKTHQHVDGIQDAFEAHFGPGAVSAVLGVPRRKP